MARITFIAADNSALTLDAEPGRSVMEIAVAGGVPGIDGNCGGSMACGTCHVHVSPEWLERCGAPSGFETGMIELSANEGPASRLSCQIVFDNSLDGLVVRTPAEQI